MPRVAAECFKAELAGLLVLFGLLFCPLLLHQAAMAATPDGTGRATYHAGIVTQIAHAAPTTCPDPGGSSGPDCCCNGHCSAPGFSLAPIAMKVAGLHVMTVIHAVPLPPWTAGLVHEPALQPPEAFV